jgi:hypothetical protein
MMQLAFGNHEPEPEPKPALTHPFEGAGLGKAPFRLIRSTRQPKSCCDYCGTAIALEFWIMGTDGRTFKVGSDCVLKTADAGLAHHVERELRVIRKAQTVTRKAARVQTAAVEFLGLHADVAAAFKAIEGAAEPTSKRKQWQLSTLRDLAAKLTQWGSLSDKQVAFAAKLYAEFTTPEAEAEKHVAAPLGRVTVRGRIVSVKVYSSQYGTSWKMTVKVQTPEGVWLCWATVPSSLMDSTEYMRDLHGREITFTATLSHGNESHFAFAKRPSGVKLEPTS